MWRIFTVLVWDVRFINISANNHPNQVLKSSFQSYIIYLTNCLLIFANLQVYSPQLSGAFSLFRPNMVIYTYLCHFTTYLHHYDVYWKLLDTSNQLSTSSWGIPCMWKARSQHIVQQSTTIKWLLYWESASKAHQKPSNWMTGVRFAHSSPNQNTCILSNFDPIENLKLLVIFSWFIGINAILSCFFNDYIIHPYSILSWHCPQQWASILGTV